MATTTEPLDVIRSRRSRSSTPPRRATRSTAGDVVLIDTREPHEYDEAHLEGGTLVPPGRGARPRSARSRPTRSQRVLLYCRTGNRSARAADAAAGGSATRTSPRGRRDPGLAGAGAARRRAAGHDRASSAMRYSRHTLLPEVGVEGQLKLLNAKVLLHRRRRARLAGRALPRRRRDRHARARRRRRGRRVQPAAPGDPLDRARRHAEDRSRRGSTIEGLNPDVDVVEHRMRLDSSNVIELLSRLRRDRRRRRQLPDPLPAQRRLGAAAQAGRLGVDPRLRGPDLDLRPLRGPLLPLPLPDAAARRARAELRRSGRARRDGRRRWACCRPTRSSSSWSASASR